METRLFCRARGLIFLSCLILGLGLLGPSGRAFGAEAVKARYEAIKGKEVVVRLTIGADTPAAIILIQRFPAGVKVVEARPSTKNTNPAKGEFKWLLRGVTSGTTSVRATLSRAVSSGELSGEVRYRPAGGGEMVVVPIGR